MHKIKKYIFLLIVFWATTYFAQNELQHLTTDDGLPSDIIYDIKQDKIGYLWIATEKGLVKFDGLNFINIHKYKTTNIYIDKNNIYAGLENGLFIKNANQEKIIKSKKVLKTIVNEDDVFVATIEGIYSLKNKKLVPLKINSTIDFSVINDIIYLKNNYYFSSSVGLLKSHNSLINSSLKKLSKLNSVSIEKFNNSIITATTNNNLIVFKQDTLTQTIETLNEISTIKKINNELWISSKTDGIEVRSLPSLSFLKKINKYNSLKTNVINTVFKAKNNSIYIASANGIYIYKEYNTTFYKKNEPSIYFENLQINHKSVDTLFVVNNLKLPHINNNISISFKSIDLNNPKKILYRYQLNKKWSPWSANNTVQLPNLNTGNYSFKIQSKINDKLSNIKQFNFKIDAPFYKKTWFILTLIASFLIISYITIYYYIEQINKRNKKQVDQLKLQNILLSLEQKALQLQMNPHFIFNVLNGIKALGNTNKIEDLNSTITNFSILLRGILNNSRKEEITLQQEIDLLKNYIALEQRMSSKTFSYNIITSLNNIDSEEIVIPTMLIQPFVENAIKHAFQKHKIGEIIIEFKVKYQYLYCSIIDNGIGFKHAKNHNKPHKSLAIQVTKERLKIIDSNNNFKIQEIKENNFIQGTKVSFKLPLKTDY